MHPVRNIALQYQKSTLNNGPLLIYLTARDQSRGNAALEAIHNDAQLKAAKALRADGGLTDVAYHPLDVSSSQSVSEFAAYLKKQHPEGIDVLVNNAGIALDGFDGGIVDSTLACNYYGLGAVTRAVLPLVRDGGRVVNIASMIGKLNKYSPEVTSAFREARTEDDVSALMERYSKAVHAGTHERDGWPSSAYAVSKAGAIGLTLAIAREQEKEGRGVLVNACCPGYVNTDMTKGRGRKTVDAGAKTPVMLAVGDIGGVSGEFWQSEEVTAW